VSYTVGMQKPDLVPTTTTTQNEHLCASCAATPCDWYHHNYKHFPARGVARADTLRGPARYLEEFAQDAIRELETATTRRPTVQAGAVPGKTEYLRKMDRLIGWDLGRDATLSFVECSGGPVGSRTFHGRPMAPEDRTARRLDP
jgi:hypothetical protein